MYNIYMFLHNNFFRKSNILKLVAVFALLVFILLILFCGHLQSGNPGCMNKALSGSFYGNSHKNGIDVFVVTTFLFGFLFVKFFKFFKLKINFDNSNFIFFVKLSEILFKINSSIILAFRKGKIHSKIYN